MDQTAQTPTETPPRNSIAVATRTLNHQGILGYSGHISARLPGGAEYLIQTLQIINSKDNSLKGTNTLESALNLYHKNYLTKSEYEDFKSVYHLLRATINALRIVRGNAKDLTLPPQDSLEAEYLSRRLRSFKQLLQNQDALTVIKKKMDQIHNLFLVIKEIILDVLFLSFFNVHV